MSLRRFFVAFSSAMLVNTAAIAGGDPAAGEAKAQQACVACHGPAGNSMLEAFPVLAGQVPGYIAKQLAAFKRGATTTEASAGVRPNAQMAPMAAPLSDEDMANLDAYYASQKPAPRAISADQVELARAGEKIYRGGYRPFSIAACIGCHGPAGHGIPPQYPRVSGQFASYLEQQLLAFKSDQRINDIMNPIAFRLSEKQIKALAVYMSGLE